YSEPRPESRCGGEGYSGAEESDFAGWEPAVHGEQRAGGMGFWGVGGRSIRGDRAAAGGFGLGDRGTGGGDGGGGSEREQGCDVGTWGDFGGAGDGSGGPGGRRRGGAGGCVRASGAGA